MELKDFLAFLMVYQNNMKMLHWRISGDSFDRYHAIAEEYYEKLGEYVDSIGEMIMSADMAPITIREAIAILDESYGAIEVPSEETLEKDEVVEYIDKMFSHILKCLYMAYDNPVVSKSHANVATLDDMCKFIELELKYKNKNR